MMDDKIYIGGLLETVQRKDLEDKFSQFGKIREVWVAKQPPGFGFVHFESRQDASKAIRVMDGKTVCGSEIRVEAARTKDPVGKSKQNSKRGPDRAPYRRRSDGRRPNTSGGRMGGRVGNTRGRNGRNRNASGRKRPRDETPPLQRTLLAALPPLSSLRRSDMVESLDRLSTQLGLSLRRSPSPLRRRLDAPMSSLRSWSPPPLPPLHLSSRKLSPMRLGSRQLPPPHALGARPLSPLRLGDRSSGRLSPPRSLDSRHRSPLRSTGSLHRLSPLRSLDAPRRQSPPSNRASSPLRLLSRNLLLEDEIGKRLGRDSMRRGDTLQLGDLGGRSTLSRSWERRLPSPPPAPSFLSSIPRYRSRSPVSRRRSPMSLLPPLSMPRYRDTQYPARDYRSGQDYEPSSLLSELARGLQQTVDRNSRQNRLTDGQERQGKGRDPSWVANKQPHRDRNRNNRDRNDSPGKGGRQNQQAEQGKRPGGRRRDNNKSGRNKMSLNLMQPNKGRNKKQGGFRKGGKKGGRGRIAAGRKPKN